MIRCLELFSGNGDITKRINEETHMVCWSVDYDSDKSPDLCTDVYTLSDGFFKGINFIWLSPDCTTYSYASHGKHRIKGGVPVSEYAKECDEKNRKFIKRLIDLNIPFIMENPRCHFRHMDFVEGLSRITVYYSSYGMPYTKPTDLFSNYPELLEGFNTTISRGRIHLDYVKGYSDFLGRCKMPEGLIEDIVKTIRRNILNE